MARRPRTKSPSTVSRPLQLPPLRLDLDGSLTG
jgi:hypothetical protein